MLDEQLRALIGESWRQYAQFERHPNLVRPAIPILFFGDLDAYLRSSTKVVTVGLNPSKAEFPEGDRFRRFRRAEGSGYLDEPDPDRYLRALNAYFQVSPYRRWFNSFEPLLNGLNASYYGAVPNTALHTDLCSPLATDPTWTNLGRPAQAMLEDRGTPLWHSLIRFLDPDVIFVSVARHYLRRVTFPLRRGWEVLHRVDTKRDGTLRKEPYEVETAQLEVDGESSAVAVFGRNVNIPFGSITNEAKLKVGSLVHGLLDGA